MNTFTHEDGEMVHSRSSWLIGSEPPGADPLRFLRFVDSLWSNRSNVRLFLLVKKC